MKILFPTDFSSTSEDAFQYAIDLLGNSKGLITIVNVYQVPDMEQPGAGSLSNFSSGPGSRLQEKVSNDMKLETETKLKNLAAKFNLNHEDYTCLAIEGNIRKELDLLVEYGNFDAVVMGFRNEQSQKGLFFGGIANHLMETANCPVFAVPPTAFYMDIKKIIYPTDLVHNELGALNWLVKFARPTKTKIHLLHIGDDQDNYRKDLAQQLCEELPYDHIDFEIVPGDDIARVILEMANKTNADMLAMTTHTSTLFQKMFHSSYSTDVLNKVNIPFIGFSEKASKKLEEQ